MDFQVVIAKMGAFSTTCNVLKYTQNIERNNFTLRTRLKRLIRKTIAFLKSTIMHSKVTAIFIER
jgi:insertion element IS1 protein InsB